MKAMKALSDRSHMALVRIAVTLLVITACGAHDLRGESSPSPDGKTYLIIADDNGGKCGPLLVDGAVWPHTINSPGEVRPCRHVIACGTDISVQVDSMTTYRFTYWGP
jgi:hypothetical protein